MKSFIRERQDLVDIDNPYFFYKEYLHTFVRDRKETSISLKEYMSIVDYLYELEQLQDLSLMEIQYVIGSLGKDQFLDNWIMKFIQKKSYSIDKQDLKLWLGGFFQYLMDNSDFVYSFVDLCVQCDMDALSPNRLMKVVDYHLGDMDVLSIVLDYAEVFGSTLDLDWLFNIYNSSIPDSIKIQILEYMEDFVGLDLVDSIDTILQDDYLRAYIQEVNHQSFIKTKSFTLLQTMFYGDFATDGRGDSGGMSILLKSFGDALASKKEIGTVVTLTLNNDWNIDKELIQWVARNHLLIRLPFYYEGDIKEVFLKREAYFYRLVKRLIDKLGLQVDIVHIRYLDNGSLVMGRYARDYNKQLVFTLTPDPHRLMPKEDVRNPIEEGLLISHLNRVLIGDQLLEMADRLVGIGSHSLADGLKAYFPQLTNPRIKHKLKMVNEAISLYDGSIYITEPIERIKTFVDGPAILNVGRLNDLKGQIRLVKAFEDSGLWKDYKLLLIGGNFEEPNAEEEKVIKGIRAFVEEHPHLQSRILHMAGMPNKEIRYIENLIIKEQYHLPHLYVCSSYKEEFGIAILEAMSAAFLALAPINGGAKSYITHGKNGFLIDTQSWESMSYALSQCIYDNNNSFIDFTQMAEKGTKTIMDNYTTQSVIDEMLTLYLQIERSYAS